MYSGYNINGVNGNPVTLKFHDHNLENEFLQLYQEKNFRESDILSRIGGDKFIVLPSNISEENISTILKRLKDMCEEKNAEMRTDYRLSFSTDMAYMDAIKLNNMDELIAMADRKKMYVEKR